MSSTFRNILAVIAGFIFGSIVNMAILRISHHVIPLPEGVDVTDMEKLKTSMHQFEPKHFLFPFLAHALGTLAGAWLAAFITLGNKLRSALIVGILFLAGGIANSFLLPAPTWFIIVDLLGAYLPMAYLGGKLSLKKLDRN